MIVDIEQRSSRAVERLAWFDPPSNPGSTILMHRQPGDIWRIDYQIDDEEDADEAVKPENVLPRVQSHLAMIGESAEWKPVWISMYNAKCLTLDDYRHGRVLFAGDAAHLVPIFGVRGMNSGLDDAGNLAWKLASVVAGRASPSLLDTYSTERVHAARINIAYGAKSTEFMAPPHDGFKLMREAVLRLALERPEVASLINPRQSSPVAYAGLAAMSDAPRRARPGEPAPEARVAHRRIAHLSECFGDVFVILRFGCDGTSAPSLSPPLEWTAWWIDRDAEGEQVLHDRHGEAFERYGASDGDVVLVRPDGYIAARWPAYDARAIDAAIASALRDPNRGGPMNAAQIDRVYSALGEALGRTHGDETRLLLAILALDLITRIDPDDALAALARAERLARV